MNGCKCIYKTKQIKPIIFIINNSNNNNNLAVDIPRGGSSCCTEFSWIEFRMLVFAQGGNPEDLEKNLWRKDKNQPKIQSTCDTLGHSSRRQEALLP